MPEKTVPKTSSLIADGLLGIAESDFLPCTKVISFKEVFKLDRFSIT